MDENWEHDDQKSWDFQNVSKELWQFQRRQQKVLRLFVAGVVLIFVYFLSVSVSISWRQDDSHPVTTTAPEHVVGSVEKEKEALGLLEVIRALYEPIKLSPTTPSWIDHEVDGKQFSLPQRDNYTWTQPLGKRVVFVDVDTRPLEGDHDVMSKHGVPFKWESFSYTASGIMNHYLYSLIHGYDYRLIRFTPFEDDLKAQWAKPHAMLSFLENNSEYDFMVVMDADAVIHYPEIPFEWLMNRWGVTENTALAMAIDILDGGRNLDSKGRLVDNTGFMIARNIPRTHEILRSWLTCPYDEVEYPGCDVFKNAWPAEQGAFSEHLRYKFNQPNDLQEIPCDEANGYPYPDPECSGRFVRHAWSDKDSTRREVNEGVMRVLMKQVWGQFRSDEGTLVAAGQRNDTQG